MRKASWLCTPHFLAIHPIIAIDPKSWKCWDISLKTYVNPLVVLEIIRIHPPSVIHVLSTLKYLNIRLPWNLWVHQMTDKHHQPKSHTASIAITSQKSLALVTWINKAVLTKIYDITNFFRSGVEGLSLFSVEAAIFLQQRCCWEHSLAAPRWLPYIVILPVVTKDKTSAKSANENYNVSKEMALLLLYVLLFLLSALFILSSHTFHHVHSLYRKCCSFFSSSHISYRYTYKHYRDV